MGLRRIVFHALALALALGFLPALAAPFATSGLAVVGPLFSGADGNTSFLRLINAGASSTTFTATVVGSPSGRTYGATAFTVAAGSAPQYAITQILTQANASALSGGDTTYAVYLQDADAYAGYQHVIYNGGNGFFENVSTCSALLAPQTGALLTNVHTTAAPLAAYPSQIRLHNFASQAVTTRVTVSDAATGAAIGTVDLQMAANASYSYPESYFEQQLHWTPGASQLHANLSFAIADGATFYGVVAHYIFNQQFTAYVNMSEICAINPRGSAAAAAPGSRFEGTIAGAASQTGTLSVAIQGSLAAQVVAIPNAERHSATAAATGTFKAAGAADVALTGTYDPSSALISLSGSGYAASGSISGETFSGSYTGPGGAAGGFSALNATQNAVTAYCGTYSSDDVGVFNVTISANGKLAGVSRPTGDRGSTVMLSGQASGSSLSGSTSDNIAFSGTLDGTAIRGTFTSANGAAGTFAGSTAGCTQPITNAGGTGSTGGSSGGGSISGNVVVKVSASGASAVSIAGPHTSNGQTVQQTFATCSGSGGGTCAYGIDAGVQVTLTAVTAAGDTFLGWSGACSGTATTCSIATTSAQQTAQAAFASGQKHTLTITSSGTGSASIHVASGSGLTCNLGAPCSGSFSGSVTITASTTTLTTFLGWGGSCSGTGSCTLDMSSDQAVTAAFASAVTHTLTVSSSGSGAALITSSPSGIFCGRGVTCNASFSGTTVLTATPESGTTFLGWGGACSGTGTCSVSLSGGDVSVTAQFSSGGGGTGGGSTGGGSTGGGSTGGAGAQTYLVTLSVNRLTGAGGAVSSAPAGIDCSGLCGTISHSFNAGTTVTLTATPDSGSSFQGWGGACSGTGACTLTVNAGQSVSATFSKP